MRILMFEEEQVIRELLTPLICKHQWEIKYIFDDIAFINEINRNLTEYDGIIVDINNNSTLNILKNISINTYLPILYLTANINDIDSLENVHIITKPFNIMTLIGKIKQIIRNDLVSDIKHSQQKLSRLSASQSKLSIFDIETDHFKINFATREVMVDNQILDHLTPKEYELLITLIQKPKQVFSREHLLSLIWNLDFAGNERTIDVHIKNLRKKIPKYGAQVIKTVWGVGYKFDDNHK